MAHDLLRLEAVTKVFGAGAGAVRVLDGVDLALGAEESAAIVGPSGSGKSTLLNIAGALEPPTAGRALFEGTDLARLADDEAARLRNRAFGFVFQHHYLLPQLTALENVLLPTLAEDQPRSERARLRARAEALLARLGLAERAAHRPAALSGGERQRVAFARALVLSPRLVLADEPTGALDQASADVLGDVLVAAQREDGVALLVVTHSERLAARMGRVLRLGAGGLRVV